MIKKGVIKQISTAGRAIYFKLGRGMYFDKKWTLHCVRIGATALLFARFRDPKLLKIQLQWDSNKWKEYIRFTPILAAQHSKVLVEVDTDNLTVEFNKLECN